MSKTGPRARSRTRHGVQRDRETERQRDRETERQRPHCRPDGPQADSGFWYRKRIRPEAKGVECTQVSKGVEYTQAPEGDEY